MPIAKAMEMGFAYNPQARVRPMLPFLKKFGLEAAPTIWLWELAQSPRIFDVFDIAGLINPNATITVPVSNAESLAADFRCAHAIKVATIHASLVTAADITGLIIFFWVIFDST